MSNKNSCFLLYSKYPADKLIIKDKGECNAETSIIRG